MRPGTLALETKDFDDLSFVNHRTIAFPHLSAYMSTPSVPLTVHSDTFLRAIGATDSKQYNEAAQLLGSLDAAAQRLQVSSSCLAEYMAAWQVIYSQNGYEQSAARAEILIEGFNNAAASVKRAIADKDDILSHVDRNVDAGTQNVFTSETSFFTRTLRHCVVDYFELKPELRDNATLGEDYGNLTLSDTITAIQQYRIDGNKDQARRLLRRLEAVISALKN